MVVGGGLEEDVCEMKETWSTSGETRNQPGPDEYIEGMAPHPVPLTVGEQDLPDPFIRRSEV